MIRATQLQAAHFLLWKNYLTAEKADHISQLAVDLVGLPAGTKLTLFLGCRSRLAAFNPGELLAELYHERRLIRNILMRTTDYVVSTADYLTWHAATARQKNQALNSTFRQWEVDQDEVETLSEAILDAIGQEAVTARTISERLPQELVRTLTQTSRGGRETSASNLALALRWLIAGGEIAAGQASPSRSGDWRRAEVPNYARLNYWYPHLDLAAAPAEANAQAQLVRAYLAAFGPAAEADISAWTGLSKSETARAVGRLASETTLVMVEGIPGMMLLLKEQADQLAATSSPQPPIVSVLPGDDSFVTAHRASRARLAADSKLQRRVYSSAGAARPTILVNGQVVGLWHWGVEGEQEQITWRLFTAVDPALLPAIEAGIERVAKFLDSETAVIQEST